MLVLGIETSCDETAAAIVDGDGAIRADLVLSQLDEHRPFGGVVPEIAARSHLETLDGLIDRAVQEAGVSFRDLSAVAATAGPGLIGGVMVGMMTGKAIALALDVPFLGINHLAAHALTARLTDGCSFPYLMLLVSGGHCQLLAVEGVGRYVQYGTTVDDAIGEAFDKAAKLLGLGYPGGPEIERAAIGARQADRFSLPRPMKGRPNCDFSFSGLKTAVRRLVERQPQPLSAADVSDLAAAFQTAVAEVVADRCRRAIDRFKSDYPGAATLVVGGGVAANQHIRSVLQASCANVGFDFVAPPQNLCTDNAVMIAWAGVERLRNGEADGLDFPARPRWPLDACSGQGRHSPADVTGRSS